MNRFRDPTLRRIYDSAIAGYAARERTLFLANGERRRPGLYGSGIAQSFWHGFDGINADRQHKGTIAYAFYRAGQDCAKEPS